MGDKDARACRTFVAHAHCMDVAQRFFFGDYPGSRACIDTSTASWTRIIVHVFCFGLFPLLSVRYRKAEHRAHGHKFFDDDDDTDEDSDDDEHDDDNISVGGLVEDAARALGGTAYWLLQPFTTYVHLLSVPCVKFATHNVRHRQPSRNLRMLCGTHSLCLAL